jgi:transcriptional regulator with XRE-family HTH domain
MREMAAEIRRRNEAFAKTPEGEEFDLRLEFTANLLRALKARRITQAEFCRKIGMKPPQFTRIVQGDMNITLTMVGRIAKGLGVHPSRLFRKRAGAAELVGA